MRSLILSLSEGVGDPDLGSQIRRGISAGTYALSPEIKEYKVLENGQVAVSTTVVVTLPPTKEIVAILPQSLIPQMVQAQPMLAMLVDPKFLTADMVTALWHQSENVMDGFFQKIAKGGLSQYSTEVLIALLNTRTGRVSFDIDQTHSDIEGIVKELQAESRHNFSQLTSVLPEPGEILFVTGTINTDEVMIEVQSVMEFYNNGKPIGIKSRVDAEFINLDKSVHPDAKVVKKTFREDPESIDDEWYLMGSTISIAPGTKGVTMFGVVDPAPPIKTIQMRNLTRDMLELLVQSQ